MDFISFFGDSRRCCTLNFNTYPSNSTPGSQEVFISDNLSVANTNNKFATDVTTRIGLCTYIKTCTDTSFPIKIKFSFIGDNDVANDVQWKIRYAYSTTGSNVYRNITDAPSIGPNEKVISKISSIATNNSDTEIREVIELNIEDININPSSGDEHILWISLERDGTNVNDTYQGSISMIQLKGVYVSWGSGGHILSY